MTRSAKIRVQLDTSQAKQDMRGLVREGERTGARVSGAVSGAVGRGLRTVGAGIGIGAGLGAVRQAASSGFCDVAGEVFGGIGKSISEFLLGDLDDKARASRSAREATIRAFGAEAGRRGEIPAEARSFFGHVQRLAQQQEAGRDIFENDSGFRVQVDDILTRLGELFRTLLTDAVNTLAEKLNPFDGR